MGPVAHIMLTDRVSKPERQDRTLQESEQKYRTLFDAMDEGYCIVEVLLDDHGVPYDYLFLEVNPAFERQTGLVEPEGKRANDLVPGLEPFWLETYGQVALTGEAIRFENRSEAMGRWFDVYAFQMGKPGDHQVAILFSDVRSRKQAEEALRVSEEIQRLTLEGIVDHAIFTTDPEGVITSWNPASERVFGFSHDEALDMTIDLLFTPEDREAGVPQAEMALAAKQGRADDDCWHLRKDGSRFYASGTVAPLWQGKQLVGFVKVARNLTKQQQAEEEREMLLEAVQDFNTALEKRVEARTTELRRSNLRFSQAFTLAPYAATISTLDKRETFLEVNEAFLELTRYSEEEIVGKTAFDLKMWSSSQDQKKLAEAQQDGRGFRDLALQLRDSEGNLLDVLLSAEVIRTHGEQHYLKMFYDVTEQKRTDEQMTQAVDSLMAEASWFSQEFVARLNHIRAGGTIEDYQPPELSRREREVLLMVAKGWTNQRISEELGLKQQTIRNYLSNIFDKLNVHSRTEAAVWAREHGLIA